MPRVEGFGSIQNQDEAQARDEALTDARRRALEQASGVQIDAETRVQNRVLVDEFVRARTKGLIRWDKVLGEGAVGTGQYGVTIEACVDAREASAWAELLVSDLAFIVVLPEWNQDRPKGQPLVENEIVSRLLKANYRVLDASRPRPCPEGSGRRIEVRLRGLPSLTEYRRAEAMLASQRWVSGLAAGAFAKNESVIVLTYPEKTAYLATRLGREPRFQVFEVDRDRIVAEFRP